jgi:hypothetical protein
MLRPRPYDFYSFATYIHPAGQLTAGTMFTGSVLAKDAIVLPKIMCIVFCSDEFCKTYLPAAVERAEGIIRAVDDICNGGWPSEPFPEDQAKLLQERVHAFETSLQDELARLPIFCCDDEKLGNFSVDKLLKGASNGYPAKTRDHLTPLCQSEIDESGKCLAYDRATASGFHILRSVELTIRQYLFAVPGFVMPGAVDRQGWGKYLELLKANGAGREVTDHLYNIKDNYRNPLMHPEDTLEMDEAVSLFAVAQSMNEMLVADMKKRGFIK